MNINILPVPEYMKGAVLWEVNKPLVIEEKIMIPKLMHGQILVKLDYSGVCHSQIMEARGKRGKDMYLPHLLGHEGTGQVVSIGANVTKVSVGDLVILGWIKGDGNNASGAKYKLGNRVINSGPVTTFSSYTIVSENRVVPLPKGMPKDIGILFGCALPTGAGIILNELKPNRGSSIAFIGLGGIGLSALMVSHLFACNPIIAIDIHSDKLKLAKKFGATHTINSSKVDPIVEVQAIVDEYGVDYCVEAAGRVDTIEMGFEMVKRNGGRCVFASHPEAGKKICIDPFELISGKEIKGSWGGNTDPDNDIPRISELYFNGELPLKSLINKRYSLDKINEALIDLENGNVFRPLIDLNM